MKLHISVEGQNCTQTGLSSILSETYQKLSRIGDTSRYGEEFRLISIIPTCVDDHIWNTLGWKERIYISRVKHEADIRLRMDYEQFVRASESEKRQLFLDMIFKSIRAVQSRATGDFNGDLLIEDIRAIHESPLR